MEGTADRLPQATTREGSADRRINRRDPGVQKHMLLASMPLYEPSMRMMTRKV